MGAPASPTNVKIITGETSTVVEAAVNAFIAATVNIFVFDINVNGMATVTSGRLVAVISYGIST